MRESRADHCPFDRTRRGGADAHPDEMAITAVTLAELSAGPHEARRNDEQNVYDEHAQRARRLDILRRAENESDPIPFGADAARPTAPHEG